MQELEAFFGNFVPRSRVKETVNALVAARELDFLRMGSRNLIQITPPKPVISLASQPIYRGKRRG
jgi:hypothetical protein